MHDDWWFNRHYYAHVANIEKFCEITERNPAESPTYARYDLFLDPRLTEQTCACSTTLTWRLIFIIDIIDKIDRKRHNLCCVFLVILARNP